MKKIFIMCIIMLTIGVTNVNAESCVATRTSEATKSLDFLITTTPLERRTGSIYIGKLTGNGSSAIAFCLDRGHHAGTTYAITPTNMTITDNMRRAYQLAYQANLKTDFGKRQYIAAQILIWLDQEGKYNSTTYEIALKSALSSYYENSDQNTINYYYNAIRSQLDNAPMYRGNLYVYSSLTSLGHQRFLSSLDMGTCETDSTRKYCPSPNNTIDITDCVNSGQDYATCVARYCPGGNTCSGYATKIVGNGAVCNNKGTANTGTFYETVDTSECGDADEEGYSPTGTTLGQYCELYCKEEVSQSYPGGLTSPISLGTNIVWPTSTATQETVWKNLYALNYTGIKNCKIVVKSKSEIDTQISGFTTTIRRLSRYSSTLNQDCSNYYSNIYDPQINSINSDIARLNNEIAALNSEIATLNQQKAQVEASYRNCSSCDRAAEQTCFDRAYRWCDENSDYVDNDGRERCATARATILGCYNICPTSNSNCSNQQSALNGINSQISAKQTELNNKRTELANKQNELTNKRNQKASDISNCNSYKNAYNGARAILNELNHCLTYGYGATDLYNFQSGTQISYDDPEFGTTIALVGNTTYSCVGCSSDQLQLNLDANNLNATYQLINNTINGKLITITADANYTLPTDASAYKYVSKKTNLPLKSPIGDYINVGYSFLPTSYKAKVGKKYNLKIYVNSLGENGKFTEIANSQPYVCNYQVTSISSPDCVCPVGTKYAGKDLSSLLSYNNDGSMAMTCADAQLKYCDDGEDGGRRRLCPDGTDVTDCINQGHSYGYCCPTPIIDFTCPDGTSLVPCMSGGYSYDYCYAKICENPPPTDDYHCPNGVPGDEMDGPLHDCVAEHMHMGYDAAVQYCKDVVCPGGLRIIYRTISLRNPFPGKTAGQNVLNTTIDFSLDNLRGRYPGTNWNSKELVKTQILMNRGVEGDKVFEKEPLYSFILDTNTIKEIRKYNDAQENASGYADFTLNCSNGVACISEQFVRNAQYGIVGGVCSNASHGNFYSCSES